MKRFTFLSIGVLCLAIVAVLSAASSVYATAPFIGYIGLFKDATHNADSVTNTVCPPSGSTFECWIWCQPSEFGLIGVEFAVRFPVNTAVVTTVQNPVITNHIGSLEAGIMAVFEYCQSDWVWTHRITLMLQESLSSKIEIVPHPGVEPVPAYDFCNCYFELEPCINLTPLYVCWTGPVGVRETSWGAIKSLF